ncbi:MAG TPA: nucleotidyltransferase family protein [Acidobacteriaceae bacterium]|nr:nucleotidyltransferase family protein [Acidobacteriaceae bacterium]
MKAMVLAAGLGTRLRPLTDEKPKALVEVAGRTMLEITLERLRCAGVREVIVNAHHFADQVVEYLRAHENFGLRVEVSREDVLLDTGGGLKQAAWFFRGEDQPFLLHNVDVVSTIDLGRMIEAHREQDALASLAVQERESSRQLLFDENGVLCGRRRGDADAELVRNVDTPNPLAFCGIHVIGPRLLETMAEEGVFSILETYLRLAAGGERIVAFRADEYYWRDLGKPEQIAAAERDRERWIQQVSESAG